MEPQDFPGAGNERGTGQLQHVTVLLETAFNADGASSRFCSGAAAAALGGRKQDAAPVRALEAHGAIARALGVRDAEGLDAVATAETRHLGSGSLDHATHADATLAELWESLAQLRERFGVKRSAEMAEPQEERGTFAPQLGEAVRLAGDVRIREFRKRVADGGPVRHPLHPPAKSAAILAQIGSGFGGGCGCG
jgi:hypothetical protein